MTLEQMLLDLEKNHIYELEYFNFEWLLTTYTEDGDVIYINKNKELKKLMENFTGKECNRYFEELADIKGAVFKIYMSPDEAYGTFELTRQYEVCAGWEEDLTGIENDIKLENMKDLIKFLLESENEVEMTTEAYWEQEHPMEAYGLSVSDFI